MCMVSLTLIFTRSAGICNQRGRSAEWVLSSTDQVLHSSVDFKAADWFWNRISERVLCKCSFICKKNPAKMWNAHKAQSNLSVGPVNIFLVFFTLRGYVRYTIFMYTKNDGLPVCTLSYDFGLASYILYIKRDMTKETKISKYSSCMMIDELKNKAMVWEPHSGPLNIHLWLHG